jgi:hypothetical protein
VRVVVVTALVAICGCDLVYGLTGRDAGDPGDDALAPCGSPDRVRNPAGCACETVTAVGPCYLGDMGENSACKVAGQVTCGDNHVWSACENASAPSAEVCFDGTDNNCDGTVDEGCTCAQADNLCLDPTTGQEYEHEIAIGAPVPIQFGAPMRIIGLSKSSMPGAVVRTRGVTCSGGMQVCTVGGACTGWYVSILELTAEPPWFLGAGPAAIAVRVDDMQACTSASRIINGSVTVVP